MMKFDRRLIKNFGWPILILALIFTAFGIINLYSASYHTGLEAFKKQLIWVVLGVFAMIAVSLLNYEFLKRYSFHIFFITLISLVVVFIIGKEVSGSKSWISVGPLSVQPSEFAKIALILIIARFYHNDFEDGPFSLK